jgi:dTMP kinase
VILDRYSYSGIAYTSAKGIEVDWCFATEKGLPKPDVVYYLKVNDIKELESRGGYGEERYERVEFQEKVKKIYEDHLISKDWIEINAVQS